ncbi:hypothetical protein [Fusobacterium polymorphum]|uniref:Uncharacterized protein n=1 Tax=Fusobacterium nucleatum subsp. polymorphum TaxID=76857 RepID=A0A2C6BQ04_FUSNP|nr:hypothetical protein [Fusobacterium polymorphum]PHI06667.1 hypothetical protein CBG54_06265 [Fusobacterium polymorphum]
MVKREDLENKLGQIINGVKGNLAKGVIIGDITKENFDENIKTFLNDEISKFKEEEIKEFLKELILSTFKKEFEQMKYFYNNKNENIYNDSDNELHNVKVYKFEKDKDNQLKSKEATSEDLKEIFKKLNKENKEESSRRFKSSAKELPKSIDQILSLLLDSIKGEN